MSIAVCENDRCKRGGDGGPAVVFNKRYCCRPCSDSVRCRRYYYRKKDKVDVIRCATCNGTGRINRTQTR